MLKFNLHEILDKQGMTMTKLSEMTGIGRPTLSKLANGQSQGIQFDTLDKISGALSVPVQDLFKLEDDPSKQHLYAVVQYQDSRKSAGVDNKTGYVAQTLIALYAERVYNQVFVTPVVLRADSWAEFDAIRIRTRYVSDAQIDDAVLHSLKLLGVRNANAVRIVWENKFGGLNVNMGQDDPRHGPNRKGVETYIGEWVAENLPGIVNTADLTAFGNKTDAMFTDNASWRGLEEQTRDSVMKNSSAELKAAIKQNQPVSPFQRVSKDYAPGHFHVFKQNNADSIRVALIWLLKLNEQGKTQSEAPRFNVRVLENSEDSHFKMLKISSPDKTK